MVTILLHKCMHFNDVIWKMKDPFFRNVSRTLLEFIQSLNLVTASYLSDKRYKYNCQKKAHTEDVLKTGNLFLCKINCNGFTCLSHYRGLQLLKNKYVQVQIVDKGWERSEAGSFLTSWPRSYSVFYYCQKKFTCIIYSEHFLKSHNIQNFHLIFDRLQFSYTLILRKNSKILLRASLE